MSEQTQRKLLVAIRALSDDELIATIRDAVQQREDRTMLDALLTEMAARGLRYSR